MVPLLISILSGNPFHELALSHCHSALHKLNLYKRFNNFVTALILENKPCIFVSELEKKM